MNANEPMVATISDAIGTILLAVRDLEYHPQSNAYCGDVESANMSEELTGLLSELEDLVENLSFGRVDEVQDKIDAFGLSATLSDGSSIKIKDLYVSTSGGVSFRKV